MLVSGHFVHGEFFAIRSANADGGVAVQGMLLLLGVPGETERGAGARVKRRRCVSSDALWGNLEQVSGS